MLSRLARELPAEPEFVFEPKWDGFRCIAERAGPDVALWSRSGRPLSRYFPEVIDGLVHLGPNRFVVDGEIVVSTGGRTDFGSLMSRLHPAASRVKRLAEEMPASYVVFDVLRLDGDDISHEPFGSRRRRLEQLLAGAPAPIQLSPMTADRDLAAAWLAQPGGRGIDGVMAKDTRAPYEPGRRTMLKVKRERTADCVVAGLRIFLDEPAVASLLLGLYDGPDLRHIGVVTSFPRARRRSLLDELAPFAVALEEHPWRSGFALEGGPTGRLRGSAGRWVPEMGLDWLPLRPVRVVEVAYDQVDGHRLRHPARFRRWRPDREPESCSIDQLFEGP